MGEDPLRLKANKKAITFWEDAKEVEGSSTDVSPYMLFIASVKVNHIPAVTHVDKTARVQTVNALHHPDFYRVIQAFYELTGCPLLINTSFNVMNEPIVCSPEDAIRCFKGTNMDVLAIEGMLIYRS